VVEDGVAHAFHILITMFCRILMWMICFTLTAPHAISTKDILDLLTHFCSSESKMAAFAMYFWPGVNKLPQPAIGHKMAYIS
jgi:hypothetical protein